MYCWCPFGFHSRPDMPRLGSYLCQHAALSLGSDGVLSWDLAQPLLLVQQPGPLIHRELFIPASQRRHRHCSAALLTVGGSAVLSQSLEGHHGVLRSREVNLVMSDSQGELKASILQCVCSVLPVWRRSHRSGSAAGRAIARCQRSNPDQILSWSGRRAEPAARRRSSPPPKSPGLSQKPLLWPSDGCHLTVRGVESSFRSSAMTDVCCSLMSLQPPDVLVI